MGDEKNTNEAEDVFKERLRDFSHEIRTPLNAMIGYSQLINSELDSGKNEAKLKEYNQTIKTATVRLLRICERVLDDTVSGERSVNLIQVDMSRLVDDVITTFQELARQKGIVIKSDFPEDFPILSTDPILVEQVFSNLISNAIKFSPDGGSITLKGEVNVENGAMIFLIRDTGPGIPAYLMLKVMQGERATTSHETGQKGWGRGLKISHDICRSLNATLRFESAEEGGTVVMFSLPLEGSSPAART